MTHFTLKMVSKHYKFIVFGLAIHFFVKHGTKDKTFYTINVVINMSE